MDKAVAAMTKKVMGDGEKKAPVKSIKLKVKFQKPDKDKNKKKAAKQLEKQY